VKPRLPGRFKLRGRLEGWEAYLVTPGALQWVRRGRRARVLHVFAGACNLINDRNEILSLVCEELDLGPFGMLAPKSAAPFNAWLKQDTPVQVEREAILLGDRFLSFGASQQWDARIPWERLRASSDRIFAWLPHLADLLRSHSPENSLARLVVDEVASSYPSTEAPPSEILQRILAAARAPAVKLCRGVVSHDLEAVRSGAHALAGLGGGLTPAGDDYMVGAMLAAWLLYPAGWARSLAETIVEAAAGRTNRLSTAWLRAAARGEAGLRWHLLLEALSVRDLAGLEDAVLELLSVGHTSGADALGGFTDVLHHR